MTSITFTDTAHYVVTGFYYNSTRRFSHTYQGPTAFQHAMGINLWRGNVWVVKASGRRMRIKEVWN